MNDAARFALWQLLWAAIGLALGVAVIMPISIWLWTPPDLLAVILGAACVWGGWLTGMVIHDHTRLAALAAMKLADAEALAGLVKRAPSTIRWWATKGWLQRHGIDKKGRTLYDVDEAEQLAATKLDNASDLHQHEHDDGGSVP